MKNIPLICIIACFCTSCLEDPANINLESSPYTEDYSITFAEVTAINYEPFATNGQRITFLIDVNPEAYEDIKEINFLDLNNVELVIELVRIGQSNTLRRIKIDFVDIEEDFVQTKVAEIYSIAPGDEHCFRVFYRHNTWKYPSPTISTPTDATQDTPAQIGSCQILDF